MNVLQKTNKMERAVATSMLTITNERIFDKGKDASNSSLGNYSDGYMSQRKKANYPSNTKIILQGLERTPKGTRQNPNKRGTTTYKATGEMENDFSVISTGQTLGLGFKNQFNADKSGWVEETYDTKIFEHTPQELKSLSSLMEKEVKKILNG